MPKSALSERLLSKEDWRGTDDDTWLMRWRIGLKYLFAYGPRATEWWAKWREYPKTLFAIRSKQGIFRTEGEGWERDTTFDGADERTVLFNTAMPVYRVQENGLITVDHGYLSRIQYYTRWHLQIQWPLMLAVHFYTKVADVPEWGKPRPDTDGKLWFFYIGAHRDGDKVYWFPSAFLGRVWK